MPAASIADVGEMLTSLVAIPAGRFRMGADDAYPEEAPAHLVEVDGFAIEANFRRDCMVRCAQWRGEQSRLSNADG